MIKVTKYPISDLQSELEKQCVALAVNKIAYDPANAQPFAESLERNGFRVASMGQTCQHFNEPIREVRQLMADGRLRHDGNPLMRWCMSNAIAVVDQQDRWMLAKRDSEEKIDALVAMLMAYRVVSLAPRKAEGPLYIV